MISRLIVFTSCTARKMDNVPINPNEPIISPQDYLDDKNLRSQLDQIRNTIFSNPKSKLEKKSTYAFDLYVNSGYAYKNLRENHYSQIKSLLLSKKLDWYFLSGGYGIIHALEPAKKYQATFNRNIAYKNNIPYTTKLWKKNLPKIIDQIIAEKTPKHFYTFGSQDYTQYVKLTNFWKKLDNTTSYKIFESTGSAGVHWISKILDELANCIEMKNLEKFDKKYPQFIKQSA